MKKKVLFIDRDGILREIKPDKVGVIIRTDAFGKNEVYFEREMVYLIKKWEEIESKMNKAPIGQVLYDDNNLITRVVRDIFNNDVDELIINDENSYWDIIDYIFAFSDNSLNLKVKLYAKEKPIFEEYNIMRELNQALNITVWLKCGGYLVIEKTEALISIDVNTGKKVAPYLEQKLDELVEKYDFLVTRRGKGLMQGVVCKLPVGKVAAAALEQGLIVITAGADVLRFVPPLVIEKQHVDEMIEKLEKALLSVQE
jgi:hypothetical protein